MKNGGQDRLVEKLVIFQQHMLKSYDFFIVKSEPQR